MAPELVQLPAQREAEVSAQAARLGAAATVRAMERLGEMLVEMRHAPDPRLLLEVALVQLTHEAAGSDVHTLMARLERREKTVAEGDTATASRPVPTDPATGKATIGGRARRQAPPAATPTPAPTTPTAPVAPAADAADAAVVSVDDARIPGLFEKDVRTSLRGMAKAIYMGAHVVGMQDGALVIGFAGEPHRVRAEEHRAEVERVLASLAGRKIALTLVVDQSGAHEDNVVQLKRAPQPPPDEEVDTSELVDVPPDSVLTPLDRLTQAFPGSEIIEERT
jgi:DNA polymerase-3 subunit gamma/tau